jgi:hypothetical protein
MVFRPSERIWDDWEDETPSLEYSSRHRLRLDNRVGGLVSGSDIARLFRHADPERLACIAIPNGENMGKMIAEATSD